MSLMTINKLTESVGAEVVGLDLERLATDDGVANAVLEALEDNGVLVFRGVHLSPEDQVAFCERMGEVDRSADGRHPVSGIYPITLDKTKNANAAYLKASFIWHIDGCTPMRDEVPQKATILSAVQVARQGGETEFASAYEAYESLSEDDKQRCERLRVVHSLEASQSRITDNPTDEELARWRARPASEHPLVWTHRNGRKSLVLGASADHIVGMDVEEGRQLLDELLAHATHPERVYRHVWSVGDTVIWDNQGVLHRAMPYEPNSPREMLRTTVLGNEPIQ